MADGNGWDFRKEAGNRIVARVSTSADAAWRLLSNNLRASARDQVVVTGDPKIVEAIWKTRAIIGEPK